MTEGTQKQEAPLKSPRLSAAKPKDFKQFNTWCNHAKRGDWCLYWTGFLMLDRDTTPFTDADAVRREVAERFGAIAWGHYTAGRVCLVQSRNGPGSFSYYAVRR